jgi:hypothetical protein
MWLAVRDERQYAEMFWDVVGLSHTGDLGPPDVTLTEQAGSAFDDRNGDRR